MGSDHYDNGTPITTPINDTIFEIFFVLLTGVIVVLFAKDFALSGKSTLYLGPFP
jgi:hypothetical protein